jgi:hypothetical protein
VSNATEGSAYTTWLMHRTSALLDRPDVWTSVELVADAPAITGASPGGRYRGYIAQSNRRGDGAQARSARAYSGAK